MDVGDARLHIRGTLIAVTIQSIHHPMKQSLVFARNGNASLAEDGGVVHAMVVIETDVLVGEEAVHAMAQDKVFRNAALQTLPLGEEPKLVGQDEGLLDVVCGKEDGLVLLDGKAMKQVHDFDTAHYIKKGRGLVQ